MPPLIRSIRFTSGLTARSPRSKSNELSLGSQRPQRIERDDSPFTRASYHCFAASSGDTALSSEAWKMRTGQLIFSNTSVGTGSRLNQCKSCRNLCSSF